MASESLKYDCNMNLTEKFHSLFDGHEDDTAAGQRIFDIISSSPESGERDGLLALLYHDGIGVGKDLDRSFELAEKAAGEEDPLGFMLLGYMCEHAETPDQAEGGPRQKYDHYDAERFYELCAAKESPWKDDAVLWLGDYYMDSARGGDPEIGVEYYESIAPHNEEAAGRLSDYYWDLVMPDYMDDEDWTAALFKWTEVAAKLDPEEYAWRMGYLYAEGVGCEKSTEKAIEYFKEACESDDWRGAKGLADLYGTILSADKSLNDKEKQRLNEEASHWQKISDDMYAAYLMEQDSEDEPEIEED